MKILFPLLAIIGGIAVAIQGQINGGLGKKVGVFEASFVSFAIGTLALLFAVLFFGKGNLLVLPTVPKWQLFGGLLGVIYLTISIFVIPKIGVAPTFASIIAGQIIMGAIIDHFGLFGGVRSPIDIQKISAIMLLFISLYLFNRQGCWFLLVMHWSRRHAFPDGGEHLQRPEHGHGTVPEAQETFAGKRLPDHPKGSKRKREIQ